MKRVLSGLLFVLMFCFGCQANPAAITVREISGISTVPVEEISALLGLTCLVGDDTVAFKEDNLTLKLDYSSPNVYRERRIMNVLEKAPVWVEGKVYVPLSFFTDYLKVEAQIDANNECFIKNRDFSLYDVVKFFPAEVTGALEGEDYPYREKILEAVELPRSMNINTPKINMDRVFDTVSLDEFGVGFKVELKNHGFTDKEIAEFSIGDFETIESTWKLEKEMIKSINSQYPELKNEDLKQWTIGDSSRYSKQKDKESLGRGLTEKQREEFRKRGILLEDIFYLRKDFHQIETILEQPDHVLKETIEGYYQFTIDMLRGM